jgi:predicted heme/steroid binding protein
VAVGYLHLITAILWFGTILYVHLVLKPAYAVRGLPPTEVRLGKVSMLIMAATGLVLAYFRVPSFGVLLHSRFGLLLTIKVSLFLVMVTAAMVVVHLIGPKLRARAQVPAGDAKSEAGKGDLTREELTQFDGRTGRPAYIGYAGRIYDVTRGEVWKGGVHFGRHQAGQDLTESLSMAPHTAERVLAMPLVGTVLASTTERRQPLPERIFYVIAYMNLGLAVAIIFIVALWRWG